MSTVRAWVHGFGALMCSGTQECSRLRQYSEAGAWRGMPDMNGVRASESFAPEWVKQRSIYPWLLASAMVGLLVLMGIM